MNSLVIVSIWYTKKFESRCLPGTINPWQSWLKDMEALATAAFPNPTLVATMMVPTGTLLVADSAIPLVLTVLRGAMRWSSKMSALVIQGVSPFQYSLVFVLGVPPPTISNSSPIFASIQLCGMLFLTPPTPHSIHRSTPSTPFKLPRRRIAPLIRPKFPQRCRGFLRSFDLT